MLARGARDRDAPIGLGLREVEPLGAVDEHRGRGFAGVEPALLDFADVGDEVGLDAARVGHELAEAAEQLVVGDGAGGRFGFHDSNIGRRSRASLQPNGESNDQGRFARVPRDCHVVEPNSASRHASRSVARRARSRSRKLSRGGRKRVAGYCSTRLGVEPERPRVRRGSAGRGPASVQERGDVDCPAVWTTTFSRRPATALAATRRATAAKSAGIGLSITSGLPRGRVRQGQAPGVQHRGARHLLGVRGRRRRRRRPGRAGPRAPGGRAPGGGGR